MRGSGRREAAKGSTRECRVEQCKVEAAVMSIYGKSRQPSGVASRQEPQRYGTLLAGGDLVQSAVVCKQAVKASQSVAPRLGSTLASFRPGIPISRSTCTTLPYRTLVVGCSPRYRSVPLLFGAGAASVRATPPTMDKAINPYYVPNVPYLKQVRPVIQVPGLDANVESPIGRQAGRDHEVSPSKDVGFALHQLVL